jgi:hypothetical protein
METWDQKIRVSLPRLLRILGRALSTAYMLMALFALAGCKEKTRSSVSSVVNGREVKASIDGRAFIQSDAIAATVRFSGHKVRVEKTRVIVDSADSAAISSSVMLVEIVARGDSVVVTADGTRVLTAKLKK